jgi:hypothetical protein
MARKAHSNALTRRKMGTPETSESGMKIGPMKGIVNVSAQ